MRKVSAVFLIAAMMLIVTFVRDVFPQTVEAQPVQAGNNGKTIWDGIYTSSQATRGKESFTSYCSSCHAADLSGRVGPTLKGDVFLGHWLEDSLGALFSSVKTMPPNNTEKPSEKVYLDILAHILEVNMFPAGTEELTADVLGNILVTGKDGPGPAPNFALVQVVGCLTQGPRGEWMLTSASEPTRTRNPDKPTAEELKASAVKPLGTHTFLLLSPNSFKPGFRIDSHKGEKLEGKGFLIRNPDDERLNITWMETLASSCP